MASMATALSTATAPTFAVSFVVRVSARWYFFQSLSLISQPSLIKYSRSVLATTAPYVFLLDSNGVIETGNVEDCDSAIKKAFIQTHAFSHWREEPAFSFGECCPVDFAVSPELDWRAKKKSNKPLWSKNSYSRRIVVGRSMSAYCGPPSALRIG